MILYRLASKKLQGIDDESVPPTPNLSPVLEIARKHWVGYGDPPIRMQPVTITVEDDTLYVLWEICF